MKIENFGDLSEYVENQDEVLKVLSKFDFDIKFNGMKREKVGLSNINMYNYTFTIKNIETGVEKSFDYSEGVGNDKIEDNNMVEGVINTLWNFVSDFCCNDMDFEEFVDIFGYGTTETNEVLKIWNVIKKNNNKLLDLMSEDDIDILRENIEL